MTPETLPTDHPEIPSPARHARPWIATLAAYLGGFTGTVAAAALFPMVLAALLGDNPLPTDSSQAAYLLAVMGIGATAGVIAGGAVFALAAALHLIIARGHTLAIAPAIAGAVVGVLATRLTFTTQTSQAPIELQLLAGWTGFLFAGSGAWGARRFT
jgi:hypothetical protein